MERALPTFIVIVGTFMAILDTTIVDIALPKMIAPLKTDLYGIQWVVTAYMIAAAVSLSFLEWFERVIGLKLMYVIGIFLFALSSYLCGISTELYQMIIFRSLQGVAEALIMVSAQAILFAIYPPEKRGFAMGIFSLGVSFAPAVGPTLGGWLTEHINWNWIFFINVPIGFFLTLASIFFLQVPQKKEKIPPFNFLSFGFISLATIFTLIVLSKGQQYGWFTSNFIAFLSLGAVISYVAYLITDLGSKNRLVELSVFKSLNFTVAFLVFMFVLGFSMYAIFYALPLYFEFLKGLSTFTTGLLLLPFAFSIGLFSIVAGALSDRWSPVGTLFIAVVVYMVSIYGFFVHFDLYTPKAQASLELTLMGAGMGLFFAPITLIALRGLEHKTILVISLLDYIRFIGGSFGTALATNILKGNASFHYDEISTLQGRSWNLVEQKLESLAHHFLAGSHSLQEALLKANYAVAQLKAKLALSYAFQDLFVWCGIFSIVGIIPIAFLILNGSSAVRRGIKAGSQP